MSVGSVLIALQASRGDGQGVTSGEFLAPLNIQPGEVETVHADGGAWASGMVYFSVVRLSAFAGVGDPADPGAATEAFFAGVAEAFRAAGRFLDRRQPEVTAGLRTAGLFLRLLVEIRMDQDQMELEFPPELLAACGRHGLGVYVISNDVAVSEVLAARHAEPASTATGNANDGSSSYSAPYVSRLLGLVFGEEEVL
jgi:hypothetical protein